MAAPGGSVLKSLIGCCYAFWWAVENRHRRIPRMVL